MRYGFDYITSGNYAGDWQELFFPVDSVVTLTTNKGDSFSGVTFSKGQSIVGPYEGISVTSGAVIAYKRSDMEKRSLFTGLLDTYGGAAVAYSLRRLSADYTGSAIRVRESATSTEADIGFNPDGTLDTTALLAHTGANDGFVVTWYDQSGNSNDATQATAANQPQIVSGGSVILENGEAAVSFDGVNDYLESVNTFAVGTSNRTYFHVLKGNTNNEVFYAFGIITESGKYWAYTSQTTLAVIGNKIWNNSPQTSQSLGVIESLGTNVTDADFYLNGSLQSSTSSASATINTATSTIKIGNNLSTAYADCNIQELIFYNTDQSSNRTAIESNINDFYSIYP